MSNDNQSAIYVFVKGNKGAYAFIISDNEFNEIYRSSRTATEEQGLHQCKSDWEAIIARSHLKNASAEFLCMQAEQIPCNFQLSSHT